MKYTFDRVLNLDNPQRGLSFQKEEGNASFFSLNPMKKLGENIKYTADLDYRNCYSSKTTCASKTSITLTIFTFGEKKDIHIKGWVFPYVFIGESYMSRTGKSFYDSICFTCKTPDGKSMHVSVKTHENFKELFIRIITELTAMTGNYPSNYSYDVYNNPLWC